MITGSAGYDRQGWHDLIATMIRLPDAQDKSVTEYLAANFPPKPERRPTLVPGDTRISIKEWIAPTLGQRVRDPLQLADKTIYWTGMFASLVGQLDPKTGEMREFKLPAGTTPHSIINDRDGYIWFTGNGNGTVGRLDPRTSDIKVYPMPDAAARDPHTPVFDRDGNLWFTLQNSNMVGRLVPATGDIKLLTMPTANARPYGIIVNSQGLLWVAYNGAGKLASIDPKTHGTEGIPDAVAGVTRAPARRAQGRHDLLRRLAGLPGPLRSEDRRVQGMAVAERGDVPALRAGGRQRRRLVQRIRAAA